MSLKGSKLTKKLLSSPGAPPVDLTNFEGILPAPKQKKKKRIANYGDIEKMYPVPASQLRDMFDPPMVAGLFEIDVTSWPFDDPGKGKKPISLKELLTLL